MVTRRYWTEGEVEILRERYAMEVTHRIAADLGRNLRGVLQKAGDLGLRKSRAFYSMPESGAENLLKGAPTRFKAGDVTWNKGLSYEPGGRSVEFRFRLGQKPHNTLQIGSYRTSQEGVLQRKVTATGYPPRDWVAVHRLVWTEANGPIPSGHIVVFKPGKRTAVLAQITPEILECITRTQLMARNTRHSNYPPELNQLIHTRAILTRAINKRIKENRA